MALAIVQGGASNSSFGSIESSGRVENLRPLMLGSRRAADFELYYTKRRID